MAQTSLEYLRNIGEPLEVSAHLPISLGDADWLWAVEQGHVDIFSVAVQDGRPTGPRNRLCRVSAGGVFFPLPSNGSQDGLAFLAVSGPDTAVARVKLARVADAKDDGDLCSAVAVAAENWVSILSAVLTAARQIPTTTEVMDEGQVTHLEPGRMVRAGARPVWVFQSVGTGRLMGRDDFPAVGKGCYVPLCGNLWLEAIEASELHAFSLSDLLRRGIDLRECLQVLHQCVCEFVRSQRGETASRERIHLVSSIEQEQVLAQSTYGYLSEVLGKAFTGPQTTTQDTLFDACQIIGQTLGLKILQPQSSARHLAMDEALLNISGASGLRTRRVKLKGQWWKDDHGPLLCTLSASGVPVALLPDRAGYYELLEPSSGARTRVDSTVAATLDLTAYVFYRPFPEGQLKPLSLLLFGLVGSWSDLRLIAWLAIGAGLVATFVPIATGVLYDSVIPSAEKTLLLQMVAGLAVGSFVGGIFQLVQGLAQLRFLGRLEASLEAAVWDRLLNLPVTFFRRFSSGDLATRAASIYQIQQAVSGAVLSSLLAGFFCVFNISLLFYYGPILGFVAMAILVVSGAVMSALFALQLRYQRPQLDLDGKISGFNIQILTSIAKIRVSAAERRAMEKWSILYSHLKALRVKFRKVGMVSAIFQASLPLVLTLAIFAVLAQIWDPDDPSIPTGRFLAFTAALTAVISGVMTAVGNLAEVLAVKPMYDRMRPILEEEPETRGSRKDPGRLSGSIEMAHVNFRYKPDGPLILKDVSLKADPGEFIALVGPSGSGKSTILRLLIRFEFPESGSIFYDGQRLADLDIQAVRRQLGVVLQGGRLLSGSIYESIAGGFQLTMEDALEAARMAALAQDIEAMPMGMHTAIGEGGAGLSGGQRQRLLIARAIVRRPKIVLFDEATSALDNIGQEQVSRSLEGLQATRIVIAHRLSTVRNADRIYVIVRGQIVESGSYDELMAMEGVFSQLAKRQIA